MRRVCNHVDTHFMETRHVVVPLLQLCALTGSVVIPPFISLVAQVFPG